MKYAINKITGTVVTASRGSKYASYDCPVCEKSVSLRRGKKIPPYFAHLPGQGTFDCENFFPGNSSFAVKNAIKVIASRRMELRLSIAAEKNTKQWSLELVLPTCKFCQAEIILDVGGRSQKLDMRSMVKSRQIGAELSVKPYRIISYTGEPDPEFVAEVERECQGLPSKGAAVFTALGSGSAKGFPLAKELRCTETFAFLWKSPVTSSFHDELEVEILSIKEGWSLALFTIPEIPSVDCILWLKKFTHLPVIPARASISAIWPFQINKTSINQISCSYTDVVLLSANMVSTSSSDFGPTLYSQNASSLLSATGVEKSPAFFALKPSNSERVEVFYSNENDVNLSLNLIHNSSFFKKYPSVDLVFINSNKEVEVVSLHERNCIKIAMEARRLGNKLECLAMPSGVNGIARVQKDEESSNIILSSSDICASHDRSLHLLPLDSLSILNEFFTDVKFQIDIEFEGLGRLLLPSLIKSLSDVKINHELSLFLRERILSFMSQMSIAIQRKFPKDDFQLINLFTSLNPKPHLLPHYRMLVKEIKNNGFELGRLR